MLFFPNQLNVFIKASLFKIASHINVLLPTIPCCCNCFSTDTLRWNYSRKDRGHQGLIYTNGFPIKSRLSLTKQRLGYLLCIGHSFLPKLVAQVHGAAPYPWSLNTFPRSKLWPMLVPWLCPSPGSLTGWLDLVLQTTSQLFSPPSCPLSI